MKKVEVVARSQEQALEKAAAQLELPATKLHVIEEYEPDELDLQTLEAEEAELPEDQRLSGDPVLFVVQESPYENIAPIQEWLQGLVERFQPGSTVEVVPSGDHLRAVIDGPEASIFIGRQGQTLSAFQHLMSRVIPQINKDAPEVHIDVGDYRDRRLELLRRVADQAVRRARKMRQNIPLKPMPSHDRKYLHNYLASEAGITTQSFGKDPHRYLLIEVEGAESTAPLPRDDNDEGGGRRRGGDSRRRGRGGRDRDNRGNRDDRGNRAGQGEPRGGGRKGRGGRRGGAQAEHDPYAEERRRLREMAATMQDIDENGEPVPPGAYEDVRIDEIPSRMLRYDEKSMDQSAFDPEKPLVDEIE
ncbi:MAG: spoIIIJ-associated protein [Candidatus Sumerlaeota bacterium]|nr:spoIIIJ-associated protein [Candidatus Sumerlaeota bacterium]